MTTSMTPTLDPPIAPVPAPAPAHTHAPLLPGVLRSEWTKLRSVRSTYWTLLAAAAGMIGLAALVCGVYATKYATMSASDRADFDPTSYSLSGVVMAQLAIGVLGVLVITGEYGTGAIRSTLVAVPQRRTVLLAKAIVFGAVTLGVGLVAGIAAFFLGQAILSTHGLEAYADDPGVVRMVVGTALGLSLLGLLALGLGTLIRHSAGAISAFVGVVLVLPGLVHVLPSSWEQSIAKFLPSNAGAAIAQTQADRVADDGTALAPWTGFLVLACYVVFTLVCAAIVLDRRDA